jgi:hypothetical protein
MVLLRRVANHSSVNMMSAANLALVFGPTLMPGPKDDMGAMLRDAAPINVLMCAMIENTAYIFAKFISPEVEQGLAGVPQQASTSVAPEAEPLGNGQLDLPPEDDGLVDRSVAMEEKQEAVALHDYTARSANELSLTKDQHLFVFGQADGNWFTGEANGQQGFVAAAYVRVLEHEEEGDQDAIFEVLTPEPDYEDDTPPGTTTPLHRVSGSSGDGLPPAPMPDDMDDIRMEDMGFPPPTPDVHAGRPHLRRGSNTSNFSRTSSFGPSFAPPMPPSSSRASLDLPLPPPDMGGLPPPMDDGTWLVLQVGCVVGGLCCSCKWFGLQRHIHLMFLDDLLHLPPPSLPELPPMPEEDEVEA